ncbi:hypothetical protein GCM10010510_32060 [Streptomyces anandii JCM 4720]|nr:hypothetical protein GCM10010510_32060 [Streptomyces anandii JCM 4720]
MEAEIGGVARQRAGPGVGVPHTEEGIALPLEKMRIGGDSRPITPGGQQEGPPPGIAPEGERVGGGGHGPDSDGDGVGAGWHGGRTVGVEASAEDVPPGSRRLPGTTGTHGRTLGPEQPRKDIGDDDGPDLTGGAEVNDVRRGR